MGLFGATGIGVGAMVGGGILALAGVAFAATGPSAILAFVLNGVIALITALTFAEMAAANPQSGGTYTFAKKAMTVQIAFGVGWIVWFASIVAAVLYAVGFGAFTVVILQQILGESMPAWLGQRWAITGLALLATLSFAWHLRRSSAGGGAFINIGKVLVFGILIAGGLAMLFKTPVSHVATSLQPFFSDGFSGLIMAMGYTFIALQGFDLIAAASGEIKDPERNIPRAMVLTLAIGLSIYVPLLFVVMTVGMNPGEFIADMSAQNPETIVAIAAQTYLGSFGFWLVMIAGIFSMLSALQANLFAASRVAMAMSKDRTLARPLSDMHPVYGTPHISILVTAGIIILLLLILPDVATAGAASSLIFLLTFALANFIGYLMRKRSLGKRTTFTVSYFPLFPIIGILTCGGLAIFQAIAEPAAGGVALAWLALGTILFFVLFESRARVVDAFTQGLDPDLVRQRGLNPLVLVPIANPANAQSMVFVADALTPPGVGKVMLLSIVQDKGNEATDLEEQIERNQKGLQKAISTSMKSGLRPEALVTIADQPWPEIVRVIEAHRVRSLILGLPDLDKSRTTDQLEKLMGRVTCDVVVMRQPYVGWQITNAKTVLVPVAGKGTHDTLRARILGSLSRLSNPEFTFLNVLPEDVSDSIIQKNKRLLSLFANRLVFGNFKTQVMQSPNPQMTLVEEAKKYDLVILGIGTSARNKRTFGDFIRKMAKETDTALVIISHNES